MSCFNNFTIWPLEAENTLADPLAHNALNNTAQKAQLSACPSQSFIIVSRDNSARKLSVGANKSAVSRTPECTDMQDMHDLPKVIVQR